MGDIAADWTLPPELITSDLQPGADLLDEYFHRRHPADAAPYYTGAMFESFAGGGDRRETQHTFTADDLVAVTLLSVEVPGVAALRILDTRAATFNELLAEIPPDLALYDADEHHLIDGSPAEELWRALRDAGVGPVTTSKLLARKRPSLLPVIDSVVKDTLQHPSRQNFWLTLHRQLRADDARLHKHLLAAREKARVDELISVIRCFDVIVWMIGKRDGVGTSRSPSQRIALDR